MQELESIKLELKEMKHSSVEFMASNPMGWTAGYEDDRIANGTSGQSKLIENSKTMLICWKLNQSKKIVFLAFNNNLFSDVE